MQFTLTDDRGNGRTAPCRPDSREDASNKQSHLSLTHIGRNLAEYVSAHIAPQSGYGMIGRCSIQLSYVRVDVVRACEIGSPVIADTGGNPSLRRPAIPYDL